MTQTRYAASGGLRNALLTVTWFNFASALSGAVGLSTGAIASMGLPVSLLEGSIFADYFWPGIILGVVVGATQLAPLIAYRARLDLAWGLFATAGFGMMIWIFIETGIIRGQSPLQLGYFATGIAQVVLVLLIVGIWPRPFFLRKISSSPRPEGLRRRAPSRRG